MKKIPIILPRTWNKKNKPQWSSILAWNYVCGNNWIFFHVVLLICHLLLLYRWANFLTGHNWTRIALIFWFVNYDSKSVCQISPPFVPQKAFDPNCKCQSPVLPFYKYISIVFGTLLGIYKSINACVCYPSFICHVVLIKDHVQYDV